MLLACLVLAGPVHGGIAAAVCGPAVWWAARLAARREPPAPPDPALPLVLDLVAAALHGGRPVPDALAVAAPAGNDRTKGELLRVAGLLRLGADPAQAWASARDGPLAPVAAAATRSAASGIKLAGALERAAAGLRADRATTATVRANRAGVAAMGPLAACFLPAFLCLGVVPVIVGIARTALGLVP